MSLFKNLFTKKENFIIDKVRIDSKEYQDNLLTFCKENTEYTNATKRTMFKNRTEEVNKYLFTPSTNIQCGTEGKDTFLLMDGKVVGRVIKTQVEKLKNPNIVSTTVRMFGGPRKVLDAVCVNDNGSADWSDIENFEYGNDKDARIQVELILKIKGE